MAFVADRSSNFGEPIDAPCGKCGRRGVTVKFRESAPALDLGPTARLTCRYCHVSKTVAAGVLLPLKLEAQLLRWP